MTSALARAKELCWPNYRSGTRSNLLWSLAEASMGFDPEEIAAAATAADYDIAPVRAAVERLAATS